MGFFFKSEREQHIKAIQEGIKANDAMIEKIEGALLYLKLPIFTNIPNGPTPMLLSDIEKTIEKMKLDKLNYLDLKESYSRMSDDEYFMHRLIQDVQKVA